MAEEAGDSSSSSRAAALTFNRLGTKRERRAIFLAIASKVTNRARGENGCNLLVPTFPSFVPNYHAKNSGHNRRDALTRAAYAKFQLCYFHIGALALDLYRVSPREYPGQDIY